MVQLKFINKYFAQGSKISFYHPSVEDTVEGFKVLDGIQSLVNGITGSDCFPYSRIHLTWESNEVSVN